MQGISWTSDACCAYKHDATKPPCCDLKAIQLLMRSTIALVGVRHNRMEQVTARPTHFSTAMARALLPSAFGMPDVIVNQASMQDDDDDEMLPIPGALQCSRMPQRWFEKADVMERMHENAAAKLGR